MRRAVGNVLAVARRELGGFFSQPAAWVFVAAFLVIAALVGLRGFFDRNVADLRDYFSGLRYAFVLLAPAAAMRLWAEERRAGTLELLLTLPVRPWQAVLGKYLAGLVVLAAALLLGSVLPLSLTPFGDFDGGRILAGYLGAFLVAATFLSVGLLASALTRSQEVAFLVSALACTVLNLLGEPWLVEKAAETLPRSLVLALADLGVGSHHEALTRGVLETRSLAYFFGVTAAALFWNVLAVERRARRPTEALVALGLSLAALLLWINLTGQQDLSGRADLTSQGSNSLTPATQDALEQVQGRLTVRAYLSGHIPEAAQPMVRKLLDLLSDLEAQGDGRVDVQVIDPSTPELQERAEKGGVTRTTVEVRNEEGSDKRKVYAGVVFSYRGRPDVAIPFVLSPDLNLEYEAVLAIRKLIFPRRRVGIAGRGASDYAAARQALSKAHSVIDLDLARMKKVPDDVALVIYAAPIPPDDREVYVLDQFVGRGGRLILLAESHQQVRKPYVNEPLELGVFAKALEAWGLGLGPGLLAQVSWREWWIATGRNRQLKVRYPWFMGPTGRTSAKSPVAAGLGRVVFPWASEVRAVGDMPPGSDRLVFVQTEPAWSLTGPHNVHPAQGLRLDPQQRRPQVVAAAVKGKLRSYWSDRPGPALLPKAGGGDDPLATPLPEPTAEGRVVLVGDTDFLRPKYLNQLGKQTDAIALLLNIVDWCLDDGSLAEIRARDSAQPLEKGTALGLEREDFVWGLNVVLLPFLVLALGLGRMLLVRRLRGRRATALRDRLAGGEESGS